MSTVYFCWLCGSQASNELAAPHYEDKGRILRFCTARHFNEYQWLFNL